MDDISGLLRHIAFTDHVTAPHPEYRTGDQPCDNFCPADPGDFGTVHDCYSKCGRSGARIFCENCSRDHHKDGWDTCKPPVGDGGADE